ncbi:hypothetical protein SCALM49S_03843 [Streptomyces californicus]
MSAVPPPSDRPGIRPGAAKTAISSTTATTRPNTYQPLPRRRAGAYVRHAYGRPGSSWSCLVTIRARARLSGAPGLPASDSLRKRSPLVVRMDVPPLLNPPLPSPGSPRALPGPGVVRGRRPGQ